MFSEDSTNKKIYGHTSAVMVDNNYENLPFQNAYSGTKIKTVYISYLQGCTETLVFGEIQQTTFVAETIPDSQV